MNRLRIASIQHGDFVRAKAALSVGEEERYFGVAKSVTRLEQLLAGRDGLIISLEAPAERVREGRIEMVGVPMPRLPSRLLSEQVRAWQVVAELERFAPTHVLVRTMTFPGWSIVRWCRRRRIPTLVNLATAVWERTARQRWFNRQYMAALNDPVVSRVYNYKIPARDSMIEYGLAPEKAFAFQFDDERVPDHESIRERPPGPCRLVFAGAMVPAKGAQDVLDCVVELRRMGVETTATLFGVGPLLPEIQRRARELGGGVTAPGNVGNSELFRAYRECTFACVPTRPGFVEGMPMSLTEALAARTPAIVSDCEVFRRAFADGQGVRFFHSGDGRDMARVIKSILDAPAAEYRALSLETTGAFWRVSATTTFSQVLDWWETQLHAQPI